MKTKKKLYIGGGILLFIIAIYIFAFDLKEKVYCGIVTNKINGIEYNKHSTTPDPILIVKFDINQEKREIHCSWITYTECEVNQRVCFKEKILDMEPTWIKSGMLSFLAFLMLIGGIISILNGCGAFDAEDHHGY